MSDYERRTRLTLTKAEANALWIAIQDAQANIANGFEWPQREEAALERCRRKLGDAMVTATARNFEKWLKKQTEVSS